MTSKDVGRQDEQRFWMTMAPPPALSGLGSLTGNQGIALPGIGVAPARILQLGAIDLSGRALSTPRADVLISISETAGRFGSQNGSTVVPRTQSAGGQMAPQLQIAVARNPLNAQPEVQVDPAPPPDLSASAAPYLSLAKAMVEERNLLTARVLVRLALAEGHPDPESIRLSRIIGLPSVVISRAVDADRSSEYQWLSQFGRQHKGQWVAVVESELVAEAATLKGLLTLIKGSTGFAGSRRPFIHHFE